MPHERAILDRVHPGVVAPQAATQLAAMRAHDGGLASSDKWDQMHCSETLSTERSAVSVTG